MYLKKKKLRKKEISLTKLSEIVGSAKLRKHDHENKTGGNCGANIPLFPDHTLIFSSSFHLRVIPTIWEPGTDYTSPKWGVCYPPPPLSLLDRVGSNTQCIGSVQPEKIRKNWSNFWVGPLFPVGPVWIFVEWIAPLMNIDLNLKFDQAGGGGVGTVVRQCLWIFIAGYMQIPNKDWREKKGKCPRSFWTSL